MVNLDTSGHAATALCRLASTSKSPFLADILRNIEPEVCIALLRAFGLDGRTVSLLYQYAVADVGRSQLDLTQCPTLDGRDVSQAIILLGESVPCLNAIRESGNLVTLRIILEFLYRMADVISYRDALDAGTAIRRCVCSLIDAVLLNVTCCALSESHIYLLVHSIRGLIERNKVPRPAVVRMQQLEYLLNPLSRFCYYSVPPHVSPRSASRLFPLNRVMDRDDGFRNKKSFQTTPARFKVLLSQALEREFASLQRPVDVMEREISAKARVFEIIARITERLFGTSPCLFGSGACGLATAASDMDVVVLQSRRLMRRMARVASFWKNAQQPDYCPFPSMARVRVGPTNVAADTATQAPGGATSQTTIKRALMYAMARREHVGQWMWLSRSTREVAAIWSGRVLGPRLARLGWSVECVESARVPILRIVAAVDSKGVPRSVKKKKMDDKEGASISMRRFFRSRTYLDPAVTVGKPKHWKGEVHDPSNPGSFKPFWELSRSERSAINGALQQQIDQFLAEKISCSETEWDVSLDDDDTATSHLREPSDDIIYVSTDISFNHEVVVHNTRLMKAYAEIEPTLVPLGLLVKHWAKQRGICDAYQGTLSGYQWMLMVIHYLQHFLVTAGDKTGHNSTNRPLPLLPNLQNPPPSVMRWHPQIVDERYDVFFYHPQRGSNRPLFPPSRFAAALFDAPVTRHDSNEDNLLPHNSVSHEPSRWPENLFKDNPYEYAKNILSPLTFCNASKCEDRSLDGRQRSWSVGRIPAEDIQQLMREYSCPIPPDHESSYAPNFPLASRRYHTSEDLKKLRLHCLVTYGDASLGTLLQEFFDYYGLRFNCYAHVVSINRTPQLPQKKSCYFLSTSPFNSVATAGNAEHNTKNVNFCVADTPTVSSRILSTSARKHRRGLQTSRSHFQVPSPEVRPKDHFVPDILEGGPVGMPSSDESATNSSSSDTESPLVAPLVPLEFQSPSSASCNSRFSVTSDTPCLPSDVTSVNFHTSISDSVLHEPEAAVEAVLSLFSAEANAFYAETKSEFFLPPSSNKYVDQSYLEDTVADLPFSPQHTQQRELSLTTTNAHLSNSASDNMTNHLSNDPPLTRPVFAENGNTMNQPEDQITLSVSEEHELQAEVLTELPSCYVPSKHFSVVCSDEGSEQRFMVSETEDLQDERVKEQDASELNTKSDALVSDMKLLHITDNTKANEFLDNDEPVSDEAVPLGNDFGFRRDTHLDPNVFPHEDTLLDASLDSLYGTDTESSCSDISDTSESFRRRCSRIEKRRVLLASRISAARTKYGLRQRPFLCILDPFEKDRTIGPGNRDGFTQLVFELLRARGLLLEAEHRFILEGEHSVNFDEVVARLFAPVSQQAHGYGAPLNLRDSSYHHPVAAQCRYYERTHSSTVRRFHEHVVAAAKKVTAHSERHSGNRHSRNPCKTTAPAVSPRFTNLQLRSRMSTTLTSHFSVAHHRAFTKASVPQAQIGRKKDPKNPSYTRTELLSSRPCSMSNTTERRRWAAKCSDDSKIPRGTAERSVFDNTFKLQHKHSSTLLHQAPFSAINHCHDAEGARGSTTSNVTRRPNRFIPVSELQNHIPSRGTQMSQMKQAESAARLSSERDASEKQPSLLQIIKLTRSMQNNQPPQVNSSSSDVPSSAIPYSNKSISSVAFLGSTTSVASTNQSGTVPSTVNTSRKMNTAFSSSHHHAKGPPKFAPDIKKRSRSKNIFF